MCQRSLCLCMFYVLCIFLTISVYVLSVYIYNFVSSWYFICMNSSYSFYYIFPCCTDSDICFLFLILFFSQFVLYVCRLCSSCLYIFIYYTMLFLLSLYISTYPPIIDHYYCYKYIRSLYSSHPRSISHLLLLFIIICCEIRYDVVFCIN